MHIGTLLGWTDAAAIESALVLARQRHTSRMAEQLGYVLTRLGVNCGEQSRIDTIRTRLCELAEPKLLVILQAPETHFQLTRPLAQGEQICSFLEQAIYAEELRSGGGAQGYGPVWSAMADAYFPGADSSGCCFQGTSSAGCEWKAGIPYRAPMLADSITVDFYSPYVALNIDQQDNSMAACERGDAHAFSRHALLQRLGACLDAIEQQCLPAQRFLTQSLRVLSVAIDPDAPDACRSVSCRAHIGKAMLVNAHLARVSAARLADSILHESVHSFLYEREQQQRWVIDFNADACRYVSPWTGALLRLDSYLHACFVWFALANFWNACRDQHLLAPSEVAFFADRAAAGFRGRKMVQPILRSRAQICDHIVDELVWLQDHAPV